MFGFFRRLFRRTSEANSSPKVQVRSSSNEKVSCFKCGKPILKRMAALKNGLCIECASHKVLSKAADRHRMVEGQLSIHTEAAKKTTHPEITCFRCNKKLEKRLLNGEYWCGQCGTIYNIAEDRAYLLQRIKEDEERIEEIKKRILQNACITCGRQLSTSIHNWCSWCGRAAASGESAVSVIQDRIRNLTRDRTSVIDTVNAASELDAFKKARLGDEQAIASVFEEALRYQSMWKSLIGLGSVVVDFLITKLRSGDTMEIEVGSREWRRLEPHEVRKAAAAALGEIGDARAVEPLIEAMTPNNPHEVRKAAAAALGEIGDARAVEPLIEATTPRMDHCFKYGTSLCVAALKAIDKIGSSYTFALLLNKLKEDYETDHKLEKDNTGRPSVEYLHYIQYIGELKVGIVKILNRILERAAAGIHENHLIVASKLKDVSVLTIKESGKEVEEEDAFGRYTYRDWYYVPGTIDCSSLRQAAQQELGRRGLAAR